MGSMTKRSPGSSGNQTRDLFLSWEMQQPLCYWGTCVTWKNVISALVGTYRFLQLQILPTTILV